MSEWSAVLSKARSVTETERENVTENTTQLWKEVNRLTQEDKQVKNVSVRTIHSI